MDRLEGVIFDFDSTLFDTSEGVIVSMREAFGAAGLEIPAEATIRRSIGLPIEEALRSVSESPLNADQCGHLKRVFLDTAKVRMVELTTELPGATNVLRELRERGLRLGIVTGKYRDRVIRTLARFEVLDIIDSLVCGDDGLQGKPSPEGLRTVLRQTNLGANVVIFVGDHPHDVKAAKAAGIASCAVASGTHSLEELLDCSPNWGIEKLSQLPSLLDRLAAGK